MDLNTILGEISGFVWGPVMLVLLLGTGLYLTIGLKLLPQRKLRYGIRMTLAGRKSEPWNTRATSRPFKH